MNSELAIKILIKKFGPPGYENEKGKLSKLNEMFWAACYAKQRKKIIYEPCEREFYDYGSGGIFVPKSSDQIRTELNALMLDAARDWNGWGGARAIPQRSASGWRYRPFAWARRGTRFF